jgi:tetratricopeptide (TPR) repeat protein
MSQPKRLTKKEKYQHAHEVAKTKPKATKSPIKNYIGGYLIIALTAFVFYGNTLSNGYVLDDFSVIKENNIVNQGVKNLGMIFSTSYRTGYLNVNDGLYRPLSLAMFAIEWSISPNNPALGHFINILIYILCAVVLLKTLQKLIPELSHQLILAMVMLFVAHPIHTEVVGNIKSRDELLCFLFSFLSIYSILKYTINQQSKFLVYAALSLFIAFLAKESAILTIPIVAVMLFYFKKDALKNFLGVAIAMFIPFVIYMLLRKGVLGSFAGLQSVTLIDNPIGAEPNFLLRLMGSLQIIGEYFQLFIFPHPLIYDYSYNSTPLNNGFNANMIAGIAVVLVTFFVFIFTFKKHPIISFSLGYIFVSLSLYSNVFFAIGAAKAERFSFLASVGYCIAIIYIIAMLLKININQNNNDDSKLEFNKFNTIIFIILILFGVKTMSRNADWKDNITLYTHDVDLNPASAKTHYYLGNELIKKIAEEEKDSLKRIAILNQGIKEVKKAVAIFSPYSDGWTQIGVGFYKLNNMDSAAVYFNKGLQFNPNNSVALSNLGAYYFNKQRYPEAIDIFKRTLDLNPRFIDAMVNLGSCYGASGQFNDAVIWFTKAYELDPNNAKAIQFLAITYQNMNQPDKAAYYQSLLK